MNKQNKLVSFVQQELNARYGLDLTIDGHVGKKTMEALNRVTAIPSHYSDSKRFIAFIQYLTHLEPLVDDIAVDGFFGPNTEHAMAQLLSIDSTGKRKVWRDRTNTDTVEYNWPTYKNIKHVFGEPGTRQSRVRVPYSLKLAWDLDRSIDSFKCHELVVEPIQEALEDILDIYGLDEIKRMKLDYWGGCYNYRRMRFGDKLSTHAWGIAVDWAPQYAKLRWSSERALLAKPEYNPFWDAWEKVGAVSLGREEDRDWMHLQFCKL